MNFLQLHPSYFLGNVAVASDEYSEWFYKTSVKVENRYKDFCWTFHRDRHDAKYRRNHIYSKICFSKNLLLINKPVFSHILNGIKRLYEHV